MPSARLISFGYQHGPPPDADVIIDVRGLSHDLSRPEAAAVRTQIATALRAGKSVAVGCEKGQHRSVALANDCARQAGRVQHRDKLHTTPAGHARARASHRLTQALEAIRHYRVG